MIEHQMVVISVYVVLLFAHSQVLGVTNIQLLKYFRLINKWVGILMLAHIYPLWTFTFVSQGSFSLLWILDRLRIKVNISFLSFCLYYTTQ